jgi:hypothetical protein
MESLFYRFSISTGMSARTEDRYTEGPGRSETSNEAVYRYGRPYRWGAYGTGGLVVLSVLAVSGAVVIKGLSGMDWGAYAGAVAGLASASVSVPSLLSELYLTEDRLRKEHPLWANREVYLDAVHRVFVGGASVELYSSSDADPALTFHRKIQGSDDLIVKLVGRLPASAQVDHPSGELSDRLGSA